MSDRSLVFFQLLFDVFLSSWGSVIFSPHCCDLMKRSKLELLVLRILEARVK